MNDTPNRHIAAEIASQPAAWRRWAARAAVPTPVSGTGTGTGISAALPAPGERVAVVGCGTSLYMARAYAALREQEGHGVTDAFPASEHRLDRGYDRVLAITRSGTTTEILDLLDGLRRTADRAARSTVLLADPSTPAAGMADAVVDLRDVDERSTVQTRFATSVLALLRAHLGHDLEAAAADAERFLAAEPAALLGPVLEARQITFVGRGWTNGLAEEAALKLRESVGMWTEAYPAMEYRHGPISIAEPGRVVWALGAVPRGLADDVRATGAHFEHAPEADPLADLVRVHRLCVLRAEADGRNADTPRNLTRSVVLA